MLRSGGALVSQLTGTGAVVFGWFVLALSVVAAALAAALPQAEYVHNRDKRRAYDRLFRDIWTYATLGLPTDDRETVKARLEEFSKDIEAPPTPGRPQPALSGRLRLDHSAMRAPLLS